MSRSLLTALSLSVLVLACSPQRSSRSMGPAGGPAMDLEARRVIRAPGVGGLEGFSQAVKVGKRIYVSGQVGVDAGGAVVGAGDVLTQAEQAFRNLKAVLLAAGATPEDVVLLDIHLVQPAGLDLAALRETGSVFFPAGAAPAGNLIGVQSLPRADLLVSLSAVAETPGLFPDREALRRFQ